VWRSMWGRPNTTLGGRGLPGRKGGNRVRQRAQQTMDGTTQADQQKFPRTAKWKRSITNLATPRSTLARKRVGRKKRVGVLEMKLTIMDFCGKKHPMGTSATKQLSESPWDVGDSSGHSKREIKKRVTNNAARKGGLW